MSNAAYSDTMNAAPTLTLGRGINYDGYFKRLKTILGEILEISTTLKDNKNIGRYELFQMGQTFEIDKKN